MLSRVARFFRPRICEAPLSQTMSHMLNITKERPLNINLETTTICNSKCCFCGYPKIKRKVEIMEMHLFESILSQYGSIGGGPIGFSPLMSDPLVDPQIVNRITRIISSKYNFWPHMFTNGIGFSKFSESELAIFAALKNINISMGGPDRNSYFKMYGVDRFDIVVDGIRALRNTILKTKSDVKIAIHFRVIDPTSTRESDLFKEFSDYGFDCSDVSNSFSSFGGIIKQADVPQGVAINTANNKGKVVDCVIPYSEYTICPSGDVVACGCFDSGLSTVVGNVKNESIIDIWKGNPYTKFRKSFSRNNISPICLTCSNHIPLTSVFNNPGLSKYNPLGETFWHFLQ